MNQDRNNSTHADRGGFSRAVERGKLARRSWISDGIVLSPADFAVRSGVTPAVLQEMVVRGQLFSVEIDLACWYPAELLQLAPSDSEAVCTALAGLDTATQLVFVMRRHGALGGKTIADAIANGHVSQVLTLASAWRAEGA